MKYKLIPILICLLHLVYGQVDTIDLPAAVVLFPPVQPVRNNQTHANISEWLNTNAALFVKSYGLGSLATLSVRGASAAQTSVLWNGIPIQSPMLGQLDFSLLPISSYDYVSFDMGANSAKWGNGAIGGALKINDNSCFSDSGLRFENKIEIGSFGLFSEQLAFAFKDKKFTSSTELSYRKATNNFTYFVASGLPEREQSNARFSQQNFKQNFHFNTAKTGRLSLNFWYQNSERQIPPTNVQNRSVARQEDRAIRTVLGWKKEYKKASVRFKAAYLYEELDYFDDQILLESLSDFQSLIGDISLVRSWDDKHSISLGLAHYYTRAFIENYINAPEENRTALYGEYKFTYPKFVAKVNLRQEQINGKLSPFVPTASLKYAVAKNISWNTNISRNFRFPTFNDRFWQPGGNPDLLPEVGWSQESGIRYSIYQISRKITFGINAYHRLINNWILWSLKPEQAFFSASNLTKVRSYGMDSNFKYSRRIADWQIDFQSTYSMTRSVNQVNLSSPQIQAGEQLIYTPIHQIKGNFSLKYKGLILNYQHLFTGKTQGINEALDNYQAADLSLFYRTQIAQVRAEFSCSIRNLYDADYFIIERRPMPGRWFSLGFNLKYSKK